MNAMSCRMTAGLRRLGKRDHWRWALRWSSITVVTPPAPRLAFAFGPRRGVTLDVVRRLVRGESVDKASSGLSAREWAELMAALERPEA
jgi:hypothetical protein